MRDERGSIVTTVAVSVVLLPIVLLMLTQVDHLARQTTRQKTKTQAFDVAEAGVDRALSLLAANPSFAGSTESVMAGSKTVGSFTTVVATVPGSPNERTIKSTGTTTSPVLATRKVALSVTLMPLGSFSFAQLSASTLTPNKDMIVNGNTYSKDAITLGQHATIVGDLVSPSNITTNSATSISGLVWSGGNVSITAGTTVNGSVYASGSVTVAGTVTGDVRANSVTLAGGSVGGAIVAPANYPAPLTRTLPTFTYNAGNYSPAPTVMTAAAFTTYWATHTGGMSGTFYINDITGVVTGPILRTTLNGNLTIITNRPVLLQKDFVSSVAATVRRLVIISTAPCCVPDSLTWTGVASLPPEVELFVFTRGLARFISAKSFRGMLYSQQIIEDQAFALTLEPAYQTIPPPGFTWDLSSAGVYDLRPGVWRDCTATNDSC